MGLESGKDKYHLDRAVFGDRPENQLTEINEAPEVDGHGIQMPVDHVDAQYEMFDKDVDLGTAPIVRVEFVPEPAPQHEGYWSELGNNVTDLREQRGESLPKQNEGEQLDLPGILDGDEAIKPGSKVIEWRDAGEKDKAPETGPKPVDSLLTATPQEIAARPERLNSMADVLAKKSGEFFKSMPDRAKRFASSMYEAVYKVPGVNRVVAKAEIAWNQMWVDRKQDRILELAGKVKDIHNESVTLNQSEGAIKQSLEIIRAQGLSGTAELEQTLANIEARKSDLDARRNSYEARISKKQESAKGFIERRNQITEKMVSKYDEKMKPLDAKMESLRGLKNTLEFQTSIMEVDHAEQTEKLSTLTKEREKIAKALKLSGLLDVDGFHPALAELDSKITSGKQRIAETEWNMKEKKQSIEQQIQETEGKTAVYKDKQKEFSRISERRSPTAEASMDKLTPSRELADSNLSESFAVTENLAESSRLTIGNLLDKWNEHISEMSESNDRKASLSIDKESFLKGARWNEGRELDFEHFVKVLDGYYRMKKIDFRDKAEMSEKFKGAKIDNV